MSGIYLAGAAFTFTAQYYERHLSNETNLSSLAIHFRSAKNYIRSQLSERTWTFLTQGIGENLHFALAILYFDDFDPSPLNLINTISKMTDVVSVSFHIWATKKVFIIFSDSWNRPAINPPALRINDAYVPDRFQQRSYPVSLCNRTCPPNRLGFRSN